jgi:hypothetical protein
MADTAQFELRFEAEAEVIRGCCGEAHEFGECPNQTNESEEDKS